MAIHFSGNIACTVRPGHVFLIAGQSSEDAERFTINFQTSKGENAAIPLHISVRFDEETIVRNTRNAIGWGPEDRTPNPLEPGETFKVYILVGDYSFQIAINDIALGYYSYRAPLNIIRTIEINHDIQSISRVDQRSVFPTLWPRIQMDNQLIAFSNDIPMKISPGHVMVISGIPSGNSQGTFAINFFEDGTRKQALHFNARFEPLYTVIRNAMNDYLNYGPEERDGDFPFVLDEPFKLAIGFTENEFKFAINGEYFGEFVYRSENQLDKLNGFKINVGNQLCLEIIGVDHIFTGSNDCDDFEQYSNLDMVLD